VAGDTRLDIDTKVSNEGRVVIPAAVRQVPGVRPGTGPIRRHGGEVRLVTAGALLSAVWANDHGGDSGNSVADLRRERLADRARSEAKWARHEADLAAETRSEDEVEAGLLARLGSNG
jgi:bifunctional DNA-binding transcriptional regulator/antitoxin component of YhaV-PrlF toxin-antitoxin module